MAQVFDVLAKLTFDKGNTDSILNGVQDQLTSIAKGSGITLGVDAAATTTTLDALNSKVLQQVQSIDTWKKNLADLKTARDAAEDPTKINALNAQIATATEQIKALQTPVKEGFNAQAVTNFRSEVARIPAEFDSVKNSASSFGSEIKKALTLGAGVAGVQGGISTLIGSVTQFEDQQRAAQGLSIALNELPNSGKEAIATLTQFAEVQDHTTQFTKASIENTIALGASLGQLKDTAKLEEFSARMEDFAARTNRSLDEVSADISNKLSSGGTVRELHIDFNPGDVEGNVDKFLAATEAKFGGFAQKIGDSPQAGLLQFQKDLQETEGALGGALVAAIDPVLPVLTELATGIEDTTKFLEENKTAVETAAGAWILLKANFAVEEAGGMSKELEELTGEATKLGKEILEHLIPGLFAKKAAETAGIAATEGAKVAQEGLNEAEEANPIGLIIGVIFLLVEGLIQLYDHSEAARNIMDSIWDVLKVGWAFIEGDFMAAIHALIDGFGGLFEVIDGIVTGDFTKVKDGAKQIGKGIQEGVTAPITGAASAAAELAGTMKKVGSESETAAETAAKAWADADNKFLASAKALEGHQQTQAQQSTDNIKGIQASVQADLQQIANDIGKPSVSLQQFRQEAAAGFKDWTGSVLAMAQGVQKNLDILSLWEQQSRRATDAQKTLGDLTGANAADNLSKAQATATADGNRLRASLQLTADAQHRTLTSQEELDIAEKTYQSFLHQANGVQNIQAQIKAFQAIDPIKAQEISRNLAQINRDFTTNIGNLQFKITVDRAKAEDDLRSAMLTIAQTQSDFFLHPKIEDNANVEDQIAILQEQFDRIRIPLTDPTAAADALAQRAQLSEKILSLQKTEHDNELADAKDSADAKIALLNSQAALELSNLTAIDENGKLIFKESADQKLAIMKDAEQKEIDAATQAAQALLAALDAKQAAGFTLTPSEQAQVTTAESDLQGKIYGIRTKYADLFKKNQLDVTQAIHDGILTIWNDLTAKTTALDATAANVKQLGFDKTENDLRSQFARGLISATEYNVKLADLTQQRTNFEASQNDDVNTRLAKGFNDVYEAGKKAIENYLAEFIAGKAAEVAAHILGEETKTVATNEGTAERIISLLAEKIATIATAAAQIVSAAATAFAQWVSAVPLVGVGLGAVAVAGIIAEWGNIKGALGFEHGGLGITGENGPEVFGPVKDFSQFASQLATQTAQATERAISGRQPVAVGQNGRLQVQLSGQTKLQGRTLVTGLTRERISQQNERLIPA